MGKMETIGGIPIYVAKPKDGIKGGLIVIHEVWGLTDHIKNVADRFAAQGYLVYAPNLLSDTDIETHVTPELQHDLFNPEKRNEVQPKLRELMAPIQSPEFARITLDKLQVVFDKLNEESSVNENVGVVGYCFGGTYCYPLAANEPRLKATVPYYGHADLTEDQMTRIHCPILAFYGQNDVRLIEQLPDIEQHMKDANVNFSCQVYEGAGHAFFNDTNPYSYNKQAAQSSWEKTLEFLDKYL